MLTQGHGNKTEGKVAPTDTNNDLTCSSCGNSITAAVKTFSVQKLQKLGGGQTMFVEIDKRNRGN